VYRREASALARFAGRYLLVHAVPLLRDRGRCLKAPPVREPSTPRADAAVLLSCDACVCGIVAALRVGVAGRLTPALVGRRRGRHAAAGGLCGLKGLVSVKAPLEVLAVLRKGRGGREGGGTIKMADQWQTSGLVGLWGQGRGGVIPGTCSYRCRRCPPGSTRSTSSGNRISCSGTLCCACLQSSKCRLDNTLQTDQPECRRT
jgi:hypothetical protein